MPSDKTLQNEPGNAQNIVLRKGCMYATVSSLGAELLALEYNGLPLLWTPDPAVWPEHSPLLFPVIGNLENGAIRIGEARYPMPMHGFAKSSPFTSGNRSEEGCTFLLHDSPETRQFYPYPFKLEVRYQLSDEGLSVKVSISNPGDNMLPASFGFHPGLRWPLEKHIDKASYRIDFPSDDELTCTRPRNGRLTGVLERLPLGGHSLALDESIFERGGLLIMSPRSKDVCYRAKGARFSLIIESTNCPNLTLWMRPGSDFLCIEPWHGLPEPENFDGDFTEKPGIELIPPGQKMDIGMAIIVKDRYLP